MSDSLLSTKFYIPRARENGIIRPRLLDRVKAVLRQPRSVGLVSGPAGFGKTTLLAEFASHASIPVAWLSLDDQDNDPIRFWTYVINACQLVSPHLGETASTLFGLPQPPPGDAIVSILINDLAQMDTEFVLILDDLHVIQSEDIHRSICQLLDHQPEKFHLFVSTRSDPPWPLARLRARNQLIEIRAADLRFTSQEAAEFLHHSMGIELSAEDVDALEARTEGWVAGLQLAALSMQGRSDISGFIKSFTGSHLYIAEYLIEEVFKNQPEEMRTFLLETSILPQLNGELCAAVTGCDDAQEKLMYLQRTNAFVVPLDDEGRWFRYHQLFAGLLAARLRQSMSAQAIQALHERAAVWSETAGLNAEAIAHFLTGENYAQALRLIERSTLPTILQGNVRTVEGWLKSIPEQIGFVDPRFSMSFAWLYLCSGSLTLAMPYAAHLKSYFSEHEIADPFLQGQWYAIQAQVLYLEGKPEACITQANRALELLPEGEIAVRILTQFELATAYQQLSMFELAGRIFQQVASEASQRGDYTSALVGISGWARMVLDQGKLHQAFQVASQGIDLITRLGKPTPFSASLFGEIGQINYYWHRLDLAMKYFEQSIQVSGRSGYIDPEMYKHIMASRMRLTEGDLAASAAEMRQAEEIQRRFPPAMIHENFVAQQVRVALAFDRLADARDMLEKEGFRFEDASWMSDRVRQSAFSSPFGILYNCGLRLMMHQAVKDGTRSDLLRLGDSAGEAADLELRLEQLPNALEAILLRCQIFNALGDDIQGLQEIERAVQLAEPEGYVSPFIEEGMPVARALMNLSGSVKDPNRSMYVQEILKAFPESIRNQVQPAPPELSIRTGKAESLLPVEKLTPRELEVLALVAAGDSNQAIAQKLFITVSAVKKHTGNIFGKLNVTSRTQAVARASELGLLPSR